MDQIALIAKPARAFFLLVLTFYRIDQDSDQRNLDRLRAAAAIADISGAEAAEGVILLTKVI